MELGTVEVVLTSRGNPSRASKRPRKDAPKAQVSSLADLIEWSQGSLSPEPPSRSAPLPERRDGETHSKRRKSQKATGKNAGTVRGARGKSVFQELVCAACGRLLDWDGEPVMAHDRLYLLTCQDCYDRITDRDMVADDEDGYHVYCCLCGEGGDVVLCDICDNVSCSACITRVCGQLFYNKLVTEEDQQWICFTCNPAPLHWQMRVRKKLITALRNKRSKGTKQKTRPKRKLEEASGGELSSWVEEDSEEALISAPQKGTRRRLSSDSSNSSFVVD